jgi:hypothetical protein
MIPVEPIPMFYFRHHKSDSKQYKARILNFLYSSATPLEKSPESMLINSLNSNTRIWINLRN